MKKIRSGVFAILVSMLMVFVMIPPLEAHASTTVTLKPGDHYNFSEKSKNTGLIMSRSIRKENTILRVLRATRCSLLMHRRISLLQYIFVG